MVSKNSMIIAFRGTQTVDDWNANRKYYFTKRRCKYVFFFFFFFFLFFAFCFFLLFVFFFAFYFWFWF